MLLSANLGYTNGIIIIIIIIIILPLVVKIPGVKKKLKADVSNVEWSEVGVVVQDKRL